MTTVDGCRLAVTVVVADEPGPVVLLRTPYWRHRLLGEAQGWARRGFTCVVGDVRGRFGSTGEFLPYVHEPADGAAVVDWVADQDFGGGPLLVAGASYGAYCAVTAALARPDVVRGVLASVPALGFGETAREPGGAARLACRVGWWAEHGGTTQPRAPQHDPSLLSQLPVVGLVERVLGTTPPGWDEMWTAPRRDERLWNGLRELRMPLLAVGGLQDPFASHTVELADAWGGPTRLVLGPWGHDLDSREPGAALGGQRIGSVYAQWARGVCSDGFGGDAGVIAVDSHGRWSSMDHGRMRLPCAVSDAAFVADPSDPFRSDVRFSEREDRALVRTDPLPAGEIAGRVTVALDAEADSVDADWVVRIALQSGDRLVPLTHAVGRYAHVPGRRREVVITTPPIGVLVAAGARLVVEVAGHHWPAHARNPHTGGDPVTATELLPGARRVHAAHLDVPWRGPGTAVVTPSALLDPPRPDQEVASMPATPTMPVESLIDPVTGIVRRLVDVAPVDGAPPRYIGVTAEIADARRLGAWPADRVSLGTTFGDPGGARTAALGEAVERYCGNRVAPGLPRATAADLRGERMFGPGDLPFFAPWQHEASRWPYRPFTDDLAVEWVKGAEDGEPCWLPASWVHLNYHSGERRREPRLHHLNYAGIATGTDERDAFRRGLLELLERDALELWWHLGGPSRGIDIDSVPGLAAELAGSRLRVHLVELPTEHPAACVAAVVVDPVTGIVGGGGAARFDPVEACTKAVLEAVHTWVFTLGLVDPGGWVFEAIRAGILAEGLYLPFREDRRYLDDSGTCFGRVRDLGAQVQVWLDERVQERLLPRFTRPQQAIGVDDLPRGDLVSLLSSLRGAGCRIAHSDLTTADVAHTPLRVVRVCATGLVPNAPAAFRYWGLPRWREVIQERGWAAGADPLGGPAGLVIEPPPFL
ncbi:CocE/NonD family hydrolase [Saccharopolyspora sp. NPDC000995]